MGEIGFIFGESVSETKKLMMISVASRTLKNLKILKTTQNKTFKNGKNLKNLEKILNLEFTMI